MNENFSVSLGWAISTLIAILSGLGIGSGGLLVIWLTLALGIDAEIARGLNLAFFVFSASASMLIHLWRGRIKPSLVISLSILALVGTLIGVGLSSRIDATLLKKIFGGMLVISGVYTLYGSLRKLPLRSKKAVRDEK